MDLKSYTQFSYVIFSLLVSVFYLISTANKPQTVNTSLQIIEIDF